MDGKFGGALEWGDGKWRDFGRDFGRDLGAFNRNGFMMDRVILGREGELYLEVNFMIPLAFLCIDFIGPHGGSD